ncbi:hypothetical protein ES319_D07G222900v1 [Gossypium barbadense]|uniref:Ubiquitin-like-conjugating enzyme ATG10 n=2 Tax=Gossypium TaxID=3633 RepID=A0A5J5QXM2_GOSBA|nr:hypothetical protein ES319_D07G222900v1 [Gossypium barbadense]TYG62545.1 hypothetical protein ES288_D07G239700v1 [Gossypium darwinii]
MFYIGMEPAKDFRIGAFAFAQKWESCNLAFPPWSWLPCPKHPWLAPPEEEGYLSLEKICISRPNEEEDIDQISQIDTGEEETCCSRNEDVLDDATLVQSNHHELHYCDFHIVYSSTFRVPVLYFRAYCSDGRPLPLDEIEKELPACASKELSKKWTFITQEEHPCLKRPWYKLHPCGTAEWMKLLFLSDTANPKFEVVLELYLLSWFSVVGQVFGLRISLKISN